jgi:hypothetical protein
MRYEKSPLIALNAVGISHPSAMFIKSASLHLQQAGEREWE